MINRGNMYELDLGAKVSIARMQTDQVAFNAYSNDRPPPFTMSINLAVPSDDDDMCNFTIDKPDSHAVIMGRVDASPGNEIIVGISGVPMVPCSIGGHINAMLHGKRRVAANCDTCSCISSSISCPFCGSIVRGILEDICKQTDCRNLHIKSAGASELRYSDLSKTIIRVPMEATS